MTASELKTIFTPKDGIISQGEHLLHSEPWWFVHPCNTATAMLAVRELIQGHESWYLSLWLGFVKSAAGLR